MNQKIIAIVRLARGEAAFYDEFTNIHLTLSNPEAAITNTMNTVRIKRAVENRVLRLVAGSFTVKEEKEEPKIVEEAPEAPKQEETVSEEEAPVAPKQETETVSEEIAPKKPAAKKKSSKKSDETADDAKTDEAK